MRPFATAALGHFVHRVTQGPNPNYKLGRPDPHYRVLKTKDVYDAVVHYERADPISPETFADISKAELRPNDVLITIVGKGSIGKSNIFQPPLGDTTRYSFTRAIGLIRPDTSRLDGRFLVHFLWGRDGKQQIEAGIDGSTGQEVLSTAYLRRLQLPIPPLPTQRAIADFLDRKTAIIDALIDKKERLIALLAEKRAALIHRAVTKGLDLNVPMKDSGVEWIGEIPAHWEVKRLKFLLSGIEQGWSPECEQRLADDGQWGVLKVGCVNYSKWNELEHKALPADLLPRTRYQIQLGDLLMSRANTAELVGSVAVVSHMTRRLLLCDKLYRLTPTDPKMTAYLGLLLNAWTTRVQHEAASSGASSSMQNISQPKAGDLLLPIPPVGEQGRLTDHLAEQENGMEAMSRKLQMQVAKLREYRQALITAAVTGQLDIPGASE